MNKRMILVLCLGALAMFLVACGGGDATQAVADLQAEVNSLQDQLASAQAAAEEAQMALEDAEAMSDEAPAAASEDTLATVRDRGELICGISGSLIGFSLIEEDGSTAGFDWDFCRAVAAAALGDADAVTGRASTATERFPILQNGEVDVLIRNTTWTISRDTALGLDFAPVTFYDGQGMIVRADSGITTLEDLEGGTVCVGAGTTTEKNLADVFRQLGIDYEPVVFTENNAPRDAFFEGRCDGFTTDKSGLAASKAVAENPDEFAILDVTMSKEPLGPVVRHGDDNWFDVVKWTVNCTIQAEELGITSANVTDFLDSDDPVVLNLLGQEGDLGQALGLENDFCVTVVSSVGNYGEIYERNVGPDTALGLERGLNAQWTEGGLLYSPPFR